MSVRTEPHSGPLEAWDPDDFESTLLRSIEHDAPPIGGAQKTLSALAAASAAGVAVHAVGAGGIKSFLTLKTLLVGTSLLLACGVVGAGLVGRARGVDDPPRTAALTASVPAAPALGSAARAADSAALVSVSVDDLPTATGPASREAAPVPPATAASAGPSTVEREIALLQAIRDDLTAGRARHAVTALRNLERDHAIRLFEPEARVLMIEALIAEGSTDEARSHADAFLRDLPNDTHVSRVRRLRDETTNP